MLNSSEFIAPMCESTLKRNVETFTQFACMVIRLCTPEFDVIEVALSEEVKIAAMKMLRFAKSAVPPPWEDVLQVAHELAFLLVSTSTRKTMEETRHSPVDVFLALFSRSPDGSAWHGVGTISSRMSRIQWAIRAVVTHELYLGMFVENKGEK